MEHLPAPSPSKKSFRYYLGNFLIFSSLILLLTIYLPILKLYIPISQTRAEDSNFSIQIPKINANSPIIDNVDPWNEAKYKQALTHGVALAKGFSEPGQAGTVYIFAHSSGSPWELTKYNTVFFRLGELKPSDQIIIKKNGKGYRYSVREIKEVWPNEVTSITGENKNQLILQTCTPIGTSLKRLLVFADPV